MRHLSLVHLKILLLYLACSPVVLKIQNKAPQRYCSGWGWVNWCSLTVGPSSSQPLQEQFVRWWNCSSGNQQTACLQLSQTGSCSNRCTGPACKLPPAYRRSSDSSSGAPVAPHCPPPSPRSPMPSPMWLPCATQPDFPECRTGRRRRWWVWWANITQHVSDLVWFP